MSTKSSPGEKLKPLSRRKKIVFSILLAATPVLFLLSTEFALRAFSYRGNLDLVVKKAFGSREMLSINRSVAGRYFFNSGIGAPEPEEGAFEINKPANTRRIFCLGESTMQGFPYNFNATAPSFLRDRLQAELPREHIEVINVGLAAVGSFVVRDLISDLLPYEPDLFVVYLGHNEFYGIYQAGSAVAIKGGSTLTRLSISLSRFKTYLLLRDAYVWLAGRFASNGGIRRETLMEQMVGKSRIPYDSPEYREALATYVENLNAIIAIAQEHHVPILFSTLVSNIRDQPPFISEFSPSADAKAQKQWWAIIADGDSAMAHGSFSDALLSYQRAVAIDSSNATGRFKSGRALEASGLFDSARRELSRARDLDALRFRASGDFEQALAITCARRGVPVSNIDSAFAAQSPHGLVGGGLILEHLHPNIAGYFLMAKVWADDIHTLGLLGGGSEWTNPPDDNELMRISNVSGFDDEVGRLRIDMLTGHWPFQSRAITRPVMTDDSLTSIALAYIDNRLTWPSARSRLGDLYADRKEFDLARREYMAVAHVLRFSYVPIIRIADFYFLERRLQEAKEYYRQSIAAEDNQYSHMKLGMVHLAENLPAEAAKEIETAFALEGHQGERFPPEGAAQGRFFLGVAYAKMGRIADARAQLQRAIAIEPGLQNARALLGQLQ